MKISAHVFLLSLLLLYTGTALANDQIEITEWPAPWKNTRPGIPTWTTRAGSGSWNAGRNPTGSLDLIRTR